MNTTDALPCMNNTLVTRCIKTLPMVGMLLSVSTFVENAPVPQAGLRGLGKLAFLDVCDKTAC